MAMSDPLGDMITRIRNGQRANLARVLAPASKMRARVLDVLQSEGFIRGYSEVQDNRGHKLFSVELKYVDGKPVIREISRVSTPGRRIYSGIKSLGRVHSGLGVSILSTPHGVMTDHQARRENVGGEVICEVF